ncbi:lipopolysaccharide biosynthesis protein [Pontibacter cellulosilyticus]|uniref:Lipopolysaccharide biosynthesis protein n=1 Tax=Pontibacter cellulosilyticus TaxID=1720253 RepID=A0A923NCW2_9BACT|nr:lipopolysaccharide biosynthesis protein [Pontibacter cellulosilyticus]MBC5995072.1 lipopolysaccharide biosynthesis protein [Pontibacter cellulosilyticus]
MESLASKAKHSFFWTISQQFGIKLLNFVVQIILARMLMPSDFGVFALLSVFIIIGNSLVDSGLTSSLIRTTNTNQDDYSTVFYINLLGSLIIYSLLFYFAPYFSFFFKEPKLNSILKIYGLTFVINAFIAVQNSILIKELKFKLQTIIELPSMIIGGVVSVLLAFYDFGVMSIVALYLTKSIVFMVLLWLTSGWIPSLRIDVAKLRYHFNYGSKLTLTTILNSIFNNIYNLYIGKYFSSTLLGYYNRANLLQSFPVTSLTTAIFKVTYPVLSGIQDDNLRLRKIYGKLMQQVLFWIAPLMTFAILTAEPLFRVVLTSKWLPAVPYFQILCVVGVLFPLEDYNTQVLSTKGRSDIYLKLEIIKKIIIIGIIMIAVQFGIFGLLFSQIIVSITNFCIGSLYSGKLIGYSLVDQLKDVYRILLITIFSGFLTAGINYLLFEQKNVNDFLQIAVNATCLTGIYLGISLVVKSPALKEFNNFFFNGKLKINT